MATLSSTIGAYFPDRQGGIITGKTLNNGIFSNPFTVEAWVNIESQYDLAGIVDASEYGTQDIGWFLGTIHDRLAFGIAAEQIYTVTTTKTVNQGFVKIKVPEITTRKETKFAILKSERTFEVNRWHHVAAVYTPGALVLFLDGQPAGQMGLPPGTIRLKDTPLLLGAMWRQGHDSMKGSLAEVRLWQGARSQEAIQRSMSTRLTGSETNLLAYFPLDEGTDIVTWDYSLAQQAQNARLTGTTTWKQTAALPLYVSGERYNPRPDVTFNPVLDFDGHQDYVSIDAPIPATKNMSFSTWIKPGLASNGVIIAYSDSASSITLEYRSDGVIVYREGEKTLTSQLKAPRDTWTHVSLIIQGPERQLVINGTADNKAQNFAQNLKLSQLVFGALLVENQPTQIFKGQIDAVSIWETARSAADIKQQMDHRLTGEESGLLGYWNFNEDGGTVINDLSPHRRSGTVHGAVWVNVSDLILQKALAVTIVEEPAPETEPEVAANAFLKSDYPIAVLYRTIKRAIKNGKLKIDGELIGDFINISYLDDILPVFLEIRKAKIDFVEADPGTIGVPGQDIANDGSLVSPEKARVVITGTVNYLETEDVDIQVSFFTSKARPQVAYQLSLSPEAEGETPQWGLGNVFPDIPFVKALNVKGPTIVLTTAATLYDPNFDSAVSEGFNFFGNVATQNTGDKMLDFIGELFQVQEMAIHAALSTATSGKLVYIIEMAFHRDITLFSYDSFRLSLSRSDIGVSIQGVPPEPKISISNDIVVRFKEFGNYTNLIWTGGIALEAESISPFFTLNGTGRNPEGKLTGNEPNTTVWREPFGIPGVEIRQASLQLGMTYAPPWIDNVGVMGNMKIGDIDGSMGVLVDTNDFDNFVIAGEAVQLTLLQILSSMSPATFVAYQALPSGFKKTLNQFVDIKIEEPKVYIVPQPTSIGGVHYRDAGVTISGRFSVWGWRAEIKVVIDYANGIIIYGRMDQINLLNGAFQITGARGEANPILDMELSTNRQYAKVSSKVVLLGVSRELYIEASESGFEFQLTNQIGSIFSSDLHCVYYSGYLAADGSMNFNLNLQTGPIKIAGVTVASNITLVDVGLNAQASLRITSAPSFRLTLNGGFRFYGHNLTMPTLDVRATPSDFAAIHTLVVNHITAQAAEIFKSIFEDAWKWAQSIADGLISFTGNAASVIRDVFKQSIEEAAKIMGVISGSIENIARDLQTAYKASAEQIAGALRSAGHVATQVSRALNAAFNIGVDEAARALKAVGYAAEDVGAAIKGVYTTSIDSAAAALKKAGYTANQVGRAIKGTFTNSANTAAKALKQAGFTANEVGGALKDAYTTSAQTAAEALKYAGYGMNEVGGALKGAYTASANEISKALKYAGYGVNEVGNWLKGAGGFGENVVNDALKQAGYAASEVDNFMKDAFGWFKDVGNVIEDTGKDIGKEIVKVFKGW